MKLKGMLVGCVFAAAISGVAAAQSTLGYGTAILIPIVAETASYSTEVWVQNPATPLSPGPPTVNVLFLEALSSGDPSARETIPAPGTSIAYSIDADPAAVRCTGRRHPRLTIF